MVELNQQINWVPEHIKDGSFGKWLENARDWSICRNRFWGSPIPVWKSDDPNYPRVDVYGSLDELERDFGVRPTDLHRPVRRRADPAQPGRPDRAVDHAPGAGGAGLLVRVRLDAVRPGALPVRERDWFEHHYPGDFIVEYIGQTRGWFYTLHVLATALFDRPAFRTCVSHGILLGDDGRKMSKSLRNYPDVYEVFDRDGSDAMRWFLMSSPVLRGGDMPVTEQGIRDAVRQVLLPLWNVWYFFSLYANAAGHAGRAPHRLAARARPLRAGQDRDAGRRADRGRWTPTTSPAPARGPRTYLDALTNWYVRRSRDRFWAGDAGRLRHACTRCWR